MYGLWRFKVLNKKKKKSVANKTKFLHFSSMVEVSPVCSKYSIRCFSIEQQCLEALVWFLTHFIWVVLVTCKNIYTIFIRLCMVIFVELLV